LATEVAPDTGTRQAKMTVPQATLQGIRSVVDACAREAPTSSAIRRKTRFSSRRVAYALDAAKLLGLIVETATGFSLSPDGAELSSTPRGSEREADVLSRRITSAEAVEAIAPGLLTANPPNVMDVARRMLLLGLYQVLPPRKAKKVKDKKKHAATQLRLRLQPGYGVSDWLWVSQRAHFIQSHGTSDAAPRTVRDQVPG
jgi:hypothetical protein